MQYSVAAGCLYNLSRANNLSFSLNQELSDPRAAANNFQSVFRLEKPHRKKGKVGKKSKANTLE